MRKNVRWLLPATAALGLLVGLSTLPARAADEKDAAAGKGAVTGTVVDKDGKPVADVKVNLIKPRRGGPGGPGGPPPAEGRKPADQANLGTHRAAPLQAEQGRPQRPEPVATATTDKDGKFEMKDVPAGDYIAAVRDEDKKVFGGARVTVKDGETATVEIKTSDKPMFGRGGRRGGGGQGGNPGGDQQK